MMKDIGHYPQKPIDRIESLAILVEPSSIIHKKGALLNGGMNFFEKLTPSASPKNSSPDDATPNKGQKWDAIAQKYRSRFFHLTKNNSLNLHKY